ncbi:hypothetical protein GCM10010199_17710 [Dactylosporangium roseum]
MMTGMDVEARRAVVAALLRLAGSGAYQDRADAGRALASFAEMPESAQPLRRLLLDADDTFVTLVTADALLRRKDPAGLALVARALADADDNHADWIFTAVQNVYMIYASERDAAVRMPLPTWSRPGCRLARLRGCWPTSTAFRCVRAAAMWSGPGRGSRAERGVHRQAAGLAGRWARASMIWRCRRWRRASRALRGQRKTV